MTEVSAPLGFGNDSKSRLTPSIFPGTDQNIHRGKNSGK